MDESIKILLFVVISVSTVLLVLIGWQIFQIFNEIRKMLVKFNLLLNNAVNMTSSLGKSLKNLSGFSEGLKTVFGIFKIFKKNKQEDKNE